MTDTTTTPRTPQINRVVELHMSLCQLSTQMNMQINYNQKSELRATFRSFRYCMIELFLLVKENKELEDNIVLKKINKWRKLNCLKIKDMRLYSDSLKLFDEFSEVLYKSNIL